jgi:hypothetical protein
MADEGTHPYGDIESFETKVRDQKLRPDAPIETWISLKLFPAQADAPMVMLGLWLPATQDKATADAYYKKAKEIEALLDDSIRAVSIQAFAR